MIFRSGLIDHPSTLKMIVASPRSIEKPFDRTPWNCKAHDRIELFSRKNERFFHHQYVGK